MLSLFGNPNMVTNIGDSKTTLELAMNAGTRTTKKIADVPGYGTVWYDETAIAKTYSNYPNCRRNTELHMTLRRRMPS
jgi:hypothetical protein